MSLAYEVEVKYMKNAFNSTVKRRAAQLKRGHLIWTLHQKGVLYMASKWASPGKDSSMLGHLGIAYHTIVRMAKIEKV